MAVAACGEEGAITVHSATQSLDAIQSAVAKVLGIPFNKVNVGEWWRLVVKISDCGAAND